MFSCYVTFPTSFNQNKKNKQLNHLAPDYHFKMFNNETKPFFEFFCSSH